MKSKGWMMVAALGAVLACGDSSSEGSSDSDAGTSPGSKDGGTSPGSKDGGTGANACTPGANTSDFPGCSEAEVQAYEACFDSACGKTLESCYGTGYKSGKYSGPCKEYITCASACDCDDVACIQKCTPSSECEACTQSLATCGLSCTSKLECAFADSGISFTDGGISFGDASINLGGTCKDLAACCNTLTGDDKTSCTMAYEQLKANGDTVCGLAISGFCP